MKVPTDFQIETLDESHVIYRGNLAGDLCFSDSEFEALWRLHPVDYHEIKMRGRLVKTPRWQQAYGADYHYTGRVNKALPVPELIQPLLSWAQETILPSLNGVLLNWYDGEHGHYIGPHRDSTVNMVAESPIVTISFGESRIFRLRPWRGKGFTDFDANDSTVFIMPYATNQAWTHEVPATASQKKRRISVTLRAFEPESA